MFISIRRCSRLLVPCLLTVLLAGCGSDVALNISEPVPATAPDGLSGQVRSGTRSVTNAKIYLYAAGTSGAASAAKLLNTPEIYSDDAGKFSLANRFSCAAGQQLYIVALGGSTDKGANPNAALMAVLGDCARINPSTFAIVNELTTVASVFALAPFMTSYAELGSATANAKGLASAFATVAKLVDIAKGSAIGPALPPGAVFDSSKLNSLANIVVQCIQSPGGRGGDGSACGQLFSLATPDGGATPTDTIELVRSIAANPAHATAALFQAGRLNAPFLPELTTVPFDWTLAITYRSGGLSSPSSTSIDKEGNIWVANAGNDTVSVLAQSGFLAFGPLSGNSLNRPVAIAIDTNGEAWVANNGGSSVSIFQGDGSIESTSFAVAGSEPVAVAVDPLGSIWVANAGSNTLTQLSLTGALIKIVSSQLNRPSGIAINTK